MEDEWYSGQQDTGSNAVASGGGGGVMGPDNGASSTGGYGVSFTPPASQGMIPMQVPSTTVPYGVGLRWCAVLLCGVLKTFRMMWARQGVFCALAVIMVSIFLLSG